MCPTSNETSLNGLDVQIELTRALQNIILAANTLFHWQSVLMIASGGIKDNPFGKFENFLSFKTKKISKRIWGRKNTFSNT